MISSIINREFNYEILLLAITLVISSIILIVDTHLYKIFLVVIPSILFFTFLSLEYKNLLYYLVFISSMLYLDTGDGITIYDAIFFFTVIAFSSFYFLPVILTLQFKIDNKFDQFYLAFIFLLAYSIFLGVLNKASLYNILGDAVSYTPFLIYFALRNLRGNQKWSKLIFLGFLFIVFFVSIRNILNYRELILSVYMDWQAESARDSSNEVILFSGSVFLISYAIYTQSLLRSVISLAGLMLTFIALVLTQSRGYWIAFIVSCISLFYVSDFKAKKKTLLLLTVIVTIVFSISALFFYDKLQVIFDALITRFQTIGEGGLDVSLKERLFESIAVIERIYSNPIAGHGFGTTYRRELLFLNYVEYRTFIHNGYLLVWFKSGILGLILFLSLFFVLIKESYAAIKKSTSTIHKSLSISSFSVLIGLLLVNNTSPQFFHFDSLLIVILITIYLIERKSPSIIKL